MVAVTAYTLGGECLWRRLLAAALGATRIIFACPTTYTTAGIVASAEGGQTAREMCTKDTEELQQAQRLQRCVLVVLPPSLALRQEMKAEEPQLLAGFGAALVVPAAGYFRPRAVSHEQQWLASTDYSGHGDLLELRSLLDVVRPEVLIPLEIDPVKKVGRGWQVSDSARNGEAAAREAYM